MAVIPIPESTAVRVWRAVLAHLKANPSILDNGTVVPYEVHDGCLDGPPEECTLFRDIADAMGGGE